MNLPEKQKQNKNEKLIHRAMQFDMRLPWFISITRKVFSEVGTRYTHFHMVFYYQNVK